MRWIHMVAVSWAMLFSFLAVIPVYARPAEQNAFFDFERPTPSSLNSIQKALYNYLEPKPLVDTIREEEKYGNEGEVLGAVGRGIVSGTESLTTSLAAAANVPSSVFRQLLKRLTDALNNIGSRIVGL